MDAKVFALVDCNNFYASCERAFQPKFENKPVIVLSNNDGCVIALSNEAKALGFAMGEPYHLCRDRIRAQGVAVFSSNYTLYGDMSRRVMTTLEAHAGEVEVYSIDEAFLDLALMRPADRTSWSRTTRSTVKQHTGIPVSIGIGPTKTLAKLANRLAKKTPDAGGVFNLGDHDIDDCLRRIEVGDIWGVGRQYATWLMGQGIRTALDLKKADPKAIRQHMTVVGERTVAELNGVSCMPLESIAEPQKGITVSRSFGRTVSEFDQVMEALMRYVGRAGEKLRRQRLMARQVTVFVMTNRFDAKAIPYARSVTCRLPYPTDYTPDLIANAARLLREAFRPGKQFQKCGVMLLDLVPAQGEKQDFFDERDQPKQARLMKALDSVNAIYGARALHFGSLGDTGGRRPATAMRMAMKSPSFTTRWDQLLQVR